MVVEVELGNCTASIFALGNVVLHEVDEAGCEQEVASSP